MDQKEIGIIVALVILALLAWVGYNFLNPIKVAPISLVPSGSTSAVNPTSQAAYNATVIGNANATNTAALVTGAAALGTALGGAIAASSSDN